MKYARQIIGYHGCSVEIADAILAGKDFDQSENDYDWLGRGIYFWEFGPDRAREWAEEQAKRKGFKPAVVGAVIQLGLCFDLLDTRYPDELKYALQLLSEDYGANGKQMPRNVGKAPDLKLRRLDCAVLNFYLGGLERLEVSPISYQTVRGGFPEGEMAFEGSLIPRQTHIQVAVRDPACIVGTFRPR
jgi:hypothetical protein